MQLLSTKILIGHVAGFDTDYIMKSPMAGLTITPALLLAGSDASSCEDNSIIPHNVEKILIKLNFVSPNGETTLPKACSSQWEYYVENLV